MKSIISTLTRTALTAAASLLMLAACAPVKDIAYFQDRVVDSPEKIDQHAGIVIQPKDMISIVVSSRNPELAAIFNLGSSLKQAETQSGNMPGYMVDNDGNIDFPIIGEIHVAGMTRWDVSSKIKGMLIDKGYLNDAVVTVEFMNFKVSVLGEVTKPGTYTIDGDKVTILQALSLAGDLTIYGKRENVTVMRELDGKRTFYNVDLCSVDLFKSPAYNLQQNDIIYVEPSQEKARESTIDDKGLRLTSIAVSSGSLLVSLTTLILTATRN